MTERHDVAELIATIDRLEALLERSELSELEVEAGGTTLVLRTPSAVTPMTVAAPSATGPAGTAARHEPAADPLDATTPAGKAQPVGHVVVAPLTGLFYRTPSPGAAPYVREGGAVERRPGHRPHRGDEAVQRDQERRAGPVRRLVAGDGALVKAEQPLIEVEPT